MADFNEYGEIIRDGNKDGRVTNDIPMFTPPEQEEVVQVMKEIENYIETIDYNQAIRIKDIFVENIKGDYLSLLLNEIGINNESILSYAVNNFENMKFEIDRMLLDRIRDQIDTKSNAIKEDLLNNEFEDSKKVNKINEKMNEKKTGYYERTKQILIDTMNDNISQLRRALDYDGISMDKIDKISDTIKSNLSGYINKFVEQFNGQLVDLDEQITKYAEARIDEFIKEEKQENSKTEEEKFREDTKVSNENNQIEKKAIAEVEAKSENSVRNRFNDEVTYGKTDDKLNAYGIFDSKDRKGKSVSELFNDDLDDKDIF